MGISRDTKLTLADLVAKKAAKEARSTQTKDVYVHSLEGNITLEIPTRDTVYKMIDMQGDGSNMADVVYANAFLVYHAVPLFRDPELLEAYDVKDKIEIVGKLLEPFEINEVAGLVMKLAGFTKPEAIEESTKN
jgi:hypothetical protein